MYVLFPMETSGIRGISFHTVKLADDPMVKLHSLVINTLKFAHTMPAHIIKFGCSSVLSWSI
jgi:hypothetical protein